MIQANELRKGNKVLLEGMLLTVKEIKEHEATFLEMPAAVEYPDIDPVPLSAEILEACGFEKRGEGTYKNDIFMWFNNQMYLKIGFDDEYEIGIQYLHELQNYFPITGTELTINLEKVKV